MLKELELQVVPQQVGCANVKAMLPLMGIGQGSTEQPVALGAGLEKQMNFISPPVHFGTRRWTCALRHLLGTVKETGAINSLTYIFRFLEFLHQQ